MPNETTPLKDSLPGSDAPSGTQSLFRGLKGADLEQAKQSLRRTSTYYTERGSQRGMSREPEF